MRLKKWSPLLLVFITSVCGGDRVTGPGAPTIVTPTPATTASVGVSLAAASLTVGGTTQATATNRDAAGNVLTGRTVVWTSSNQTVAMVSASGVVTAVGVGTTSITATSEGQSGSAFIVVSAAAAPVATVTVLLNPVLKLGETTQASTLLTDAAGNVLSGRSVTWSTSNPSIATVSQSGLVTTVGVGNAVISATSEGKAGSSTVFVSSGPLPVASVVVTLNPVLTIGQTTQASAILSDATGNVLAGRVITWSTSNPSAATVSPTGLVTAVGAGSSIITATSEGRAGSATVTIASAANCASSSLAIGQSAAGNIQQSQCAITDYFFSGRSFTGPENGGTYFYNLYTIDVAPGSIAQVATTRGTLPQYAVLVAFDQSGVLVTRGNLDAPVTLNNSTTATKRYQVLVTTFDPGKTGTYTVSRGPQ
jgi:uncharacterized protein YjdB